VLVGLSRILFWVGVPKTTCGVGFSKKEFGKNAATRLNSSRGGIKNRSGPIKKPKNAHPAQEAQKRLTHRFALNETGKKP